MTLISRALLALAVPAVITDALVSPPASAWSGEIEVWQREASR